MSALSHFDSLEFVKKSKELGANEELAEYKARKIEQAIEIAVSSAREDIQAKDMATKKDLEIAKNQIILWVTGLFVASGLIQHFF
ncbi:MAG: hypothetical protein QG673_1935 [Pseudomonadota bacterium]|nr:hypothetical protein [Pseudomonadota bacterium]